MFVILWEYEVKPSVQERFERVYGTEGEWVALFQTDTNFVGTRLFQDCSRPGVYLTIDTWSSAGAYQRFRAANQEAYAALDHATESLTLAEKHLGSAEME